MKRQKLFSRLGIPHFHRSISASREKTITLRVERECNDWTRVPIQSDEFARIDVDDIGCSFVSARGDVDARGIESNARRKKRKIAQAW
jgi:hypothetical protein